jgi:tetratricopeptide (TPR) repeat protein
VVYRSNFVNTLIKIFWGLLLMAGTLSAANPLDLPAELDARIHAALEANYRMDFVAGAQELAAAEDAAEAHPLIAFGDLLIEWWRVTAAVWEEDRELCQPMLAAADRSLAAAEVLIAAGDPTGEGHLVKGATLGLLGRWHIKNRHWMKSYFIGKDAKENLERALAINPALVDAYSGIGIYDYFVAKLPGIVRWLAFTGQTADPAVGMAKVETALAEGTYTVVGTKAALALIYIRNELNPVRALELIDELVAAHPDSPFFGSLRLIALYDLNRSGALEAEAARQTELFATGGYPAERAAQVHFAQGLAHFRSQDWAAADLAYAKAVEQGHPSDPFATWALLHRGNILDVRGERTAARKIYREVRKLLNRWGTERLAERYLRDAFDPAIHQVRLLPDG